MSPPPPLPPRPPIPPEDAPGAPSPHDADAIEGDMSEQQLRDLYDSEEIDRFLHLFSAYVTEVQLQHDSTVRTRVDVPSTSATSLPQAGQDWESVESTAGSRPSSPSSPLRRGISEEIAWRFILPILPPDPRTAPLFTLGRLRLTMQRLYLAIQPVYGPFFAALITLATWKNRQKSFIFCTVFWILWYYNLLLPCLFLRILYALVRRKLFSYPTLAELRAHRQEIDRANEFGQEMSMRFSASSTLGVKELWRLFKVFNRPKKQKVNKLARNKGRVPQGASSEGEEPEEISTVLDSEDPQENDGKRALLQAMAEIADLHERVKNIFIWRRPATSRVYGLVLTFLLVLTLLMPAKYLAKLTYFTGGFFFWHVTPVISALPRNERARLPPAFSDVPTDADYAMELISRRVAAGLDVQPARLPRAKQHDKKENSDTETDTVRRQKSQKKDNDVDWKKWGERAAVGMTWAEDGKRIFTAGQWPQNTNRAADLSIETRTFPAQHTSAPGLITLTSDKLFFTPLMASNAKVEIPLAQLRGVKKKSGIFSALTVSWLDGQDDREERFRWVGGRDELFARLVGAADGRRWIKA
ncbi:hypothetical protein C8R43DRAFT_710389 [Mycena crocata]|nr:hypothetical protein C8R43DRAFT_710389 [Mycena crocata]